jgi:hypothetical protein
MLYVVPASMIHGRPKQYELSPKYADGFSEHSPKLVQP